MDCITCDCSLTVSYTTEAQQSNIDQKMSNDHRGRIFTDFCKSTSLHGFNYLSNGTSISQKVFWVIVMTIMTVMGMSLLVQNTGDFCNSRIVTTINSSSAPLDVSMILIPELK